MKNCTHFNVITFLWICRPSLDPAATDRELQKKLNENRKIGRKRLDEVHHVLTLFSIFVNHRSA